MKSHRSAMAFRIYVHFPGILICPPRRYFEAACVLHLYNPAIPPGIHSTKD